MATVSIQCFTCGLIHSSSYTAMSCKVCGGLLEVKHHWQHGDTNTDTDTDKLKAIFQARLGERMGPMASGVWRYKELICPDLPDEQIVTRYEGNTGLYNVKAIEQYVGIRKAWVKAQSENPSGSFKDNGMTVAVSMGKSLGYTKFACSSTGNTSSSLAMYAAWAGLEAHVYIPDKAVSANKILQTSAYGAQLVKIPGNYNDGLNYLEAHSDQLGLYLCNSVNPWRIEGQKSIIMEIAQSFNWTLPDWIIIPGGALSNVSALGKGLMELFELGFIRQLPRIAVVQAEGASPFHRMIQSGATTLTAEINPSTRANAMNIGQPPSWPKALQTLQQTNGVTVSITDEAILSAKIIVDRCGIGCEPASAATVAGLRQLVLDGVIDKDSTAVCILTGHLLKDTEILQEAIYTHLADALAPPIGS